MGWPVNIDTHNNALDFDLAKSVGEYFHLSIIEMDAIIKEVKVSVSAWKKLASELNILRTE